MKEMTATEVARMTPASTKAPNGKAIIDFVEDLAKSGNLAAGDTDFEQAMHAVLERRSANRVVRADPWRE